MMINTTLGHYRIVEQIGAGGMGVVYRARDERLDRDVAVKVLPEEVAADPERLARFEREAKLLASLNHPNIATLHGLEEEETQRFLVMELVEGESLAGVLGRGAIPVDDALPIALQIAQALEMAHEHGVIHRDLKPANVMVDSEGGVKVLDFGLAKAFDPEASRPQSPESIAESPTLTAEMTRAGTLLGTAAYMSPEQARGKSVDKRADIWAFGCVLYEMLANARAFAGTTSTEVLAGIIKEEPHWDVLPPETPTPVRRLLRRCLTKDPRDRLHDIADARIELQSLSTEDYLRDDTTVSTPVRAGWRTWLPWGLAPVLAALAVAILVGYLRTPSPGAVTKVLVGLEPAEWLGSVGRGTWTYEDWRLSRTAMALSPNGRFLVYSAGDDDGSRLYLRAMGETRGTPITGTEGGVGPFFSPSGEWIGFWADDVLRKVRIDGGPSMVVCDAPLVPYGASWGPADNIFLGSYQGGILRVSAVGGTPREITSLEDGERDHMHPQILADGETLLFSIIGKGDWDDTRVVAQRLNTGERKILVENGTDPRYAPTGHLVFARQGTLMAAPFDPTRLEVTGDAVVVLESVRQGVNAGSTFFDSFSGQYSFSTSGTLVHVPGGVWSELQMSLVWVDRAGRAEPLSVPPGPYLFPRLSPDGARLAVRIGGNRASDIWVHEIASGTLTRLTFEETWDSWPLWTPDGSRITYLSRSVESGHHSIATVPADGSGAAEILLTTDLGIPHKPASWSPDGQVLATLQFSEATAQDIWMLPLEGEPQPFIESPFQEGHPTFSPNGRWLAYTSDQSGRMEIYVTPYPGPGPRVKISTGGGHSPVWAPNGRELFFCGYRDTELMRSMWAVDISTEQELSAKKARELFAGKYLGTLPNRSYDVTPDGQTFLMIKNDPQPVQPVTHLHVTLNWFEELKRLAPTD